VLTGAVLVCEARDRAAFEAILKRVIELATPLAMQGKLHIKNRQMKHGEHTIEYVVIGGAPVPVAPAWAMVGDRCVMGLLPQTVAAALDQIDPKRRKSSILDHEDFKAARAFLPKEITSVSCWNSRFFTRLVYPLALHALTAGHSFMVPYMPGDIAALPSVGQQLETARLGIGVGGVVPEGIYYEAVGPDDLISSGATTFGLVGVGAGLLLPAIEQGREQARVKVSMSQMKQIGMALHSHAADHQDALPGSLDELVEAGRIPRELLTSPFDEPGTVSYTYVDPGKRVSQLQNPGELVIAFENDPGGRIEVNLLFADGSVRRAYFWDAQVKVLEAYNQAGRKDEVPIRWRPDPE
jgi:prepilin-type processing-associated H-X9-DG protein